MPSRPTLVAFDVIETLFSLESLRPRLIAAGLDAALELWFAQLLYAGVALDTAGTYKSFREVAVGTLEGLLITRHGHADPTKVEHILTGFATLDAHPDVAPAMNLLREAGIRIVALTNGNAALTQGLLAKAGVAGLVERVISVEEVQHWKPRAEVYLHCAATVGLAPARIALVAAHGWDIEGAGRAGFTTGYVSRANTPFPSFMRPPDASGSSLTETVEGLLKLTST